MSRPIVHQVPDNLVQLYLETRSSEKVAIILGVGSSTVCKWLKDAGVQMNVANTRHPIPADFAEIAAKPMGITAMAAHWGMDRKVVLRWFKQTGLPLPKKYRPQGYNKRPVPADFAEHAPHMTQGQLEAAYSASHGVVRRWLGDAGVSPRKVVVVPIARDRGPGYVNIAPSQTYGPEDAAADTLRKFGAVFRCDERGRADHKGKLWRFGNVVLTGDELIARAERKAA